MSEECTNCGDRFVLPTQCIACELYQELGDTETINGARFCEECYEMEMEDFMSYEQCVKAFEELCPESVFRTERGSIDRVARREAFNNYTDSLCKDLLITQEEYHSMDNPY